MKKLISALVIITLFCCSKPEPINIKLSGPIFGTGYNIQYNSEGNTNYQQQFDSLFGVVNQSLSTYMEDSDISKLNRNELTKVDQHFEKVFNASEAIYRLTQGVFDPTIGNVVNAWNFGAEKNKFLTDSVTIDSLMRFVGLDKVSLVDHHIKKPKEILFGV